MEKFEIINKIKENLTCFFKKNVKILLFLVCFCAVSFVYNLNIQSLNYILKRGTVLEYSVSQDEKLIENSKSEIRNKLLQLNIKYSFVDVENNSKEVLFDKDNKQIKNSLFIALPLKIEEKNKQIVDEISEFVFNKFPTSKLEELTTLKEIYSNPFNSFLMFMGILFISIFVWVVLLYLFFDYEKINNEFKENILNYFKNLKNGFLKHVKNTKEQGLGYLIKIILFDEKECDEKTDYTKEIISTILFVILAVIVIRYFIGELRWIPSGSMRPTILEHDRVFVEKLDYPKKEIKRGDILVFYPPETTLSNSPFAILSRLSGIFCRDIAFIKRVIGLPNDKFEIKQDEVSGEYRVFINDVALNEPYISSKVNWTPCNSEMYCGPFTIPKDQYFMMGDNRDNSQDSRFWGFLDRNRVIGRANFMFWPIARINKLKDRYFELNQEKFGSNYVKYDYILNRY